MRQTRTSKALRSAVLVAAIGIVGAATPNSAAGQANPNTSPGTAYGTTQAQPSDNRDNDRDWGWLGLLGLAGLLGLRRRDRHVHVDHVDTTTRRSTP